METQQRRRQDRFLQPRLQSGRGAVRRGSATILAEITLDDGGAMLARVITSEPAAVASGMRVELVPMPEAARFPLPTFRPAK